MSIHEPVLLQEVMTLLVPPSGATLMIDATVGEGGHSEAFLLKYPDLTVIGVDTDPSILETARQRLAVFANRARLINAWYGTFLADYDEDHRADLILMDLGISRFHYEASGRGFSFDRDESLDMRLNPGLPSTAADLVNSLDQRELAEILFRFGEEKFARQIAFRIVRQREKDPITSASRLANVVASAVPAKYQHQKIHPATRTFQALRIAVNRELEQLEEGLALALAVLSPGGRIGVISFHSLEDRIVKRFFRDKSRECTCPPGMADLSMWGQSGVAPGHRQARHGFRGRSFPEPRQPQREAACCGEAPRAFRSEAP